MKTLTPAENIEQRIYLIRGHRVMLDRDLAKIYGVSTTRLNQQVNRNKARFPNDFVFRLTKDETKNWISQFATSNSEVKMGLRKPPYAFNRLRHMALAHKDLARALAELTRRVSDHDEQFKIVFSALQQLLEPAEKRSACCPSSL